jgi:circadian clock protein KaiC
VRKFRGGSYLPGRHTFTITEAGAEVFPRLEACTLASPVAFDDRRALSTGVAGLDHLSGVGGLRSSTATLTVGPGGSGKTALGSHFLGGSTPQEPGLFFGFNEPSVDVLHNADACGISLSQLAADGALYTYWQPNLENILDELGHHLIRMVKTHRVRRVFVDDLNGFAAAAVQPERLDRFVAALTLELRRLGVTSMFSAESNEFNGRPPASVSSLTPTFDNLITLRTIETGERIARLLCIVKMRGCDFDGSLHRYGFGPCGMVLDDVGEGQPAGESTARESGGGGAGHLGAVPPEGRP